MKLIKVVCFAALLGFGSASFAENAAVLITPEMSGNTTTFNVEYLGNNKAVGIQFEVDLSAYNTKGAALKCQKGGSLMAMCRIEEGVLKYALVDINVEPLDSGQLFKFSLTGGAKAGNASIVPRMMLTADAQAQKSQGELLVEQPSGEILSNDLR